MERFVRGDIVVVTFPFSDLSLVKRRPAIVLAEAGGDDYILSQITSQTVRDNLAIEISAADFACGSLKKASNVRPNRLFTADRHLILYKAGELKKEKIIEILTAVLMLFAI
ncbi:MAG: type II toxin-antitoxin system PemK/MazF family toxin [Candidatus Riflebacteria bacterium]